jgi:hypothetical protein
MSTLPSDQTGVYSWSTVVLQPRALNDLLYQEVHNSNSYIQSNNCGFISPRSGRCPDTHLRTRSKLQVQCLPS